MLEAMATRSLPQVELQHGPFRVEDARQFGMRWDDLQTKFWTRLSRGQYAWVGLRQDWELKMRAVAQRLPAEYAFSGLTAAWLLGLDVAWCEPIEATIGRDVPVRARVKVRAEAGNFVGRTNMNYRDPRLFIEYDGENNKGRMFAAMRRQNAFVNAAITCSASPPPTFERRDQWSHRCVRPVPCYPSTRLVRTKRRELGDNPRICRTIRGCVAA